MNQQKRLLVHFILASTLGFVAACAATTFSMLRLIRWYLRNCGTAPACKMADWMIDFWWLPFIAVTMAATVCLRVLYDRMARSRRVD
jgi:H+/Cl- antiporter ClcA